MNFKTFLEGKEPSVDSLYSKVTDMLKKKTESELKAIIRDADKASTMMDNPKLQKLAKAAWAELNNRIRLARGSAMASYKDTPGSDSRTRKNRWENEATEVCAKCGSKWLPDAKGKCTNCGSKLKK